MPRSPRKQSEGDVYHVYARGVGRQLIYENDADRVFFLRKLQEQLAESQGTLFAWVLMGNHFHLMVKMPLGTLSTFMKNLQAVYAQHYNKKYEHVGHLFQGRFGSQPITSDEQLMACVRYIHRNPIGANLSKTCDYKWSSYRGYLKGAAVTSTDFVLSLFGGVEPFVRFHQSPDDGRFSFIDVDDVENSISSARSSDERADWEATKLLGEGWRESLVQSSKIERNAKLRVLKDAGLSVRQIERLTGIGRNIISRA